MHAAIESVSRLGINIPLAHEAAEGCLDVTGRATKPVIQVKMAEGSIQIIAPEQAHDAPTQPQAFGIGRGPSKQPLGLGKFVDLFLGLLRVSGWSLLLIRWFLIIILGICRIVDER